MKKTSVYELAACAVMAAVLCVLAPMTVPVGPIPVTLATLVLYLSVYVLRTRSALLSCAIYLLLGAFGLPVFSGWSGGFAKLAGPTGGYLAAYLLLVLISGLFVTKSYRLSFPESISPRVKILLSGAFAVLGMLLGTAVLYAFGTAWFMFQTKSTLKYAHSVCVLPFIAGDLAKIALAAVVGRLLRAALIKAGLLLGDRSL
ncbi:MAG: biotin transporter BioY [Lachnospiraceae bacterium]|nr:biotin transporter BioY [Lachnospiraceae bacterium]